MTTKTETKKPPRFVTVTYAQFQDSERNFIVVNRLKEGHRKLVEIKVQTDAVEEMELTDLRKEHGIPDPIFPILTRDQARRLALVLLKFSEGD